MTGDPQSDVFILQPATDRAARNALLYYATQVQYDNPALAIYLRAWVQKLYDTDERQRQNEVQNFPDWLLDQSPQGDTIYPKGEAGNAKGRKSTIG